MHTRVKSPGYVGVSMLYILKNMCLTRQTKVVLPRRMELNQSSGHALQRDGVGKVANGSDIARFSLGLLADSYAAKTLYKPPRNLLFASAKKDRADQCISLQNPSHPSYHYFWLYVVIFAYRMLRKHADASTLWKVVCCALS